MKKSLLSAAAVVMSATVLAVTPATFEVRNLQTGAEDCTSPLPNEMAACAMIYGDYDNDGDLDLFYIGGQNADRQYVGLLRNDNGVYTKVELSEDFQSLQQASAAWIDYNNDGNLDLVLVGSMDGTSTITMVMKNLGAAENYAFEEDLDNYLPGIYGEGNDNTQHSIAVIDYNNDGWMDIVLTGNAGAKWDGEHGRLTALFRNNKGIFEFADGKATIGAEVFDQINGGGVTVGDANNDGYMDILVTGYSDIALKPGGEEQGNGVVYMYLNDGKGSFTKADIAFDHAQNQSIAFFADVNNDGWNEIIELGRDLNNGWNNAASVWMNNNGTFTKLDSCGLSGGQAVVSVGDVNNDGFMDFAYIGWPTQVIAYGSGDGVFTEVAYKDCGLADICARGGSMNLVDLNGDKTLDVQTSGWSDLNSGWRDGEAINKIEIANQAPTVPVNVTVVETVNGYDLSWEAATDDHTPAAALRYNVYVKNADGQVWMLNPADIATGVQKVAGGYVNYLNTTKYHFNIPSGSYTFGVQAIDQANACSAFVSPAMSAVDNISVPAECVKVVENGQFYIQKNGVKYSALGQIR